MSDWKYKGKEFTSDMIGDYVGFVYAVTDTTNGMKYIGQKRFWSIIRLPPLKGKKRKRRIVKESDWKTYYGSSDNVKLVLEEKGPDNFEREILHLCYSKGMLNYEELREQVERGVLFKPDEYYNGIIQCRINRSHVLKKLK